LGQTKNWIGTSGAGEHQLDERIELGYGRSRPPGFGGDSLRGRNMPVLNASPTVAGLTINPAPAALTLNGSSLTVTAALTNNETSTSLARKGFPSAPNSAGPFLRSLPVRWKRQRYLPASVHHDVRQRDHQLQQHREYIQAARHRTSELNRIAFDPPRTLSIPNNNNVNIGGSVIIQGASGDTSSLFLYNSSVTVGGTGSSPGTTETSRWGLPPSPSQAAAISP